MKELAKLLKLHNFTISTAESCTGGLIAGEITKISGISDNFHMGVVTYSNNAKHKLIGVKNETLEKFGAVSEETASEMVMGIMKLSKSDCAIAVTGIAGPTGGTTDKPVGLVYIGCGLKNTIKVKRYVFSGDRDEVRKQTVQNAIYDMKSMIKSYGGINV